MRYTLNLNSGWRFSLGGKNEANGAKKITVNLPHTYNKDDGTDGGADYYRGKALYETTLPENLPPSERYFLEIGAACAVGEVFVGEQSLSRHEGGYSRFRVDITEAIKKDKRLSIEVDNSAMEEVYPAMADFTFYGGLYRGVRLIAVPNTHFDLSYYGSDGIMITSTPEDGRARVKIETFVTDMRDGDEIIYTLLDSSGREIFREKSKSSEKELIMENPRLWHGRRDPYLYTARATLVRGEEVLDEVCARFGIRKIEIDPERGFILNGEEYPLRGVSRHQDREGYGSALLPEHHREDMALIAEMGANSIRLAHYQHDEYFYSLADEYGMVVWAEIPYISKHENAATQNAVSQMKELVIQCYNHPSIAMWGLSNEITIGGSADEITDAHRLLNELCHSLDPSRKTVVAALSACDTDEPYLKIPDAVAYNHYFGWYGGEVSMNGAWFDAFHEKHPNIPIGCSEYGCEALDWHSPEPVQGDYTEEYQAYYHEELIKQFFKRKYLFATYVWNMFDFGADARAEGGRHGRNHKGLITFDRKYKKDSFYAYKAWLSPEPFVHIAGKRYEKRHEAKTRVTVYSNLPEVELFSDGVSLGKQRSEDHFFKFELPLSGRVHLTARAGSETDECYIEKVDAPFEKYILKDTGTVLNWFDISAPEGMLSLRDKISEVKKTPEGEALLTEIFSSLARNMKGEGTMELDLASGGGALAKMLDGFTLLRLFSTLGAMATPPKKEELLEINKRLNKIKKR